MSASPLESPRPSATMRRAQQARQRPRAAFAERHLRSATVIALALAAMAFGGCGTQRSDRSGLFEPYRTDLPQGNYVTREMLDQVQPGMARAQVRAALGSPLLEPMFRADRWDYVFRYLHASGRSEQRRVTIHFSEDKVASIEADELPLREDPTDPALPGSAARR